ncbi:hypothetical protein CNECB9_4820056 [Cupriavidus necator]|uniref:Uncharacterized protein n=1 Tax=Cupriavidus necator TaxID=106590 RepID=A0A1K0IM33_CUPNE|nr:hypothetical protein CNECB9_4820056 [Cupriavidus necator]
MLLGRDPARFGNALPSIVPYGMFDAADGPLIIAVGNNSQFEKFCRQVVERSDIVEDPRVPCTARVQRSTQHQAHRAGGAKSLPWVTALSTCLVSPKSDIGRAADVGMSLFSRGLRQMVRADPF